MTFSKKLARSRICCGSKDVQSGVSVMPMRAMKSVTHLFGTCRVRHARICVELNILLAQAELVLEESNRSLSVLVLDNRIGVSVRLENLEVL